MLVSEILNIPFNHCCLTGSSSLLWQLYEYMYRSGIATITAITLYDLYKVSMKQCRMVYLEQITKGFCQCRVL